MVEPITATFVSVYLIFVVAGIIIAYYLYKQLHAPKSVQEALVDIQRRTQRKLAEGQVRRQLEMAEVGLEKEKVTELKFEAEAYSRGLKGSTIETGGEVAQAAAREEALLQEEEKLTKQEVEETEHILEDIKKAKKDIKKKVEKGLYSEGELAVLQNLEQLEQTEKKELEIEKKELVLEKEEVKELKREVKGELTIMKEEAKGSEKEAAADIRKEANVMIEGERIDAKRQQLKAEEEQIQMQEKGIVGEIIGEEKETGDEKERYVEKLCEYAQKIGVTISKEQVRQLLDERIAAEGGSLQWAANRTELRIDGIKRREEERSKKPLTDEKPKLQERPEVLRGKYIHENKAYATEEEMKAAMAPQDREEIERLQKLKESMKSGKQSEIQMPKATPLSEEEEDIDDIRELQEAMAMKNEAAALRKTGAAEEEIEKAAQKRGFKYDREKRSFFR